MATSLIRTILLMAGLSTCGATGALEFLPDPTRPAVDLSVGKNNAVGAPDTTATTPVVVKEVLQSVIISPQYRAAVISGETVMLGDKYKGATLIDVLESSVVLNDAQGKRVLQLYPGVRLNKIAPVAQVIANEQSAPVEKKKRTTRVSKKHKAPELKGVAKNKEEGQNK